MKGVSFISVKEGEVGGEEAEPTADDDGYVVGESRIVMAAESKNVARSSIADDLVTASTETSKPLAALVALVASIAAALNVFSAGMVVEVALMAEVKLKECVN